MIVQLDFGRDYFETRLYYMRDILMRIFKLSSYNILYYIIIVFFKQLFLILIKKLINKITSAPAVAN